MPIVIGLRRSFTFALILFATVLAVCAAEEKMEWGAAYEKGVKAFYAGDYSDAVQALENASELAKQFVETDRRRVLNRAVLAMAYQFANQTSRAESLFVDVKAALHPDDAEERRLLVFVLDGLSQIRYLQGRWSDAEELLVNAMKLCGESVLSQCRGTLLRHMGEVYLTLDRTAEAEASLKQAVEIIRANPETPRTALATSLLSLGSVYMAKEQYDLAKPLLEEAVSVNHKIGDTSQALADSLLGLARLYRLQKDPARAVPLLSRAVRIYEQANDPMVVAPLNELGLISIGERKFSIARQHLERALEISSKVYGPAHIRTAYIELALAQSYMGERNFDQAANYVNRALITERAALPAGNVELARALVFAAQVEQSRHLNEEADKHYRQAIDIFRQSGDPENSERKKAEEGYARFAKGLRK